MFNALNLLLPLISRSALIALIASGALAGTRLTMAAAGLSTDLSPDISSELAACLSAKSIPIILPTDVAYATASCSLGAKSPRHPVGIAYPPTPRAIVDVVTCAHRFNIPMTVRNGGHSFQGESVQSGRLVIDVSKTCDGTRPETTPSVHRIVDGGDSTGAPATLTLILTITAGCLHADILYALHRHNITDHFAITGGMPLVGYIGWATGGGFGNTTPAAGLGCDQFINWHVVLYNGTSVDVNAHAHTDLFHDLCGGGIDFGVITHATIQLTPHPDASQYANSTFVTSAVKPAYTRIILSYPQHALPAVFHRLQTLLVSNPGRIGGHGPTIRPNSDPNTLHHFCLLYLGPIPSALDLLDEFHLLSPDLFGGIHKREHKEGKPWYHPLTSYLPTKPAFPGTPPQLALVDHTPALRPTLALLVTRPHVNIILAQTSTYPEAMAPMILVDSLAMDQDAMCRTLELMGGACSSAGLPHFGSRVTTDIILDQLIANRTSDLFNIEISTRLGDVRNEYRRKYAPGIVIDDVVDTEAWRAAFRVVEERQCSFMVPHLLGGRVRGTREAVRAFSWTNGTLVLGVVSDVVGADDVIDQEHDRQYQWTCLHEFHRVLSASPTIKAYYNYLGEAEPTARLVGPVGASTGGCIS